MNQNITGKLHTINLFITMHVKMHKLSQVCTQVVKNTVCLQVVNKL